MTLEQLTMYLWHEMPLIGWACIVAAAGVCAGVAIFLEGKLIMRANAEHTKTLSVTADGSVVESESYGVGDGYEYGRKMAHNGLWIILTSLVAFVGFLRFL